MGEIKTNPINIEISANSNGTAKVLINGTDYSMKVTHVTFEHIAGDVATVRLEFIPDTCHVVGSVMAQRVISNKPI